MKKKIIKRHTYNGLGFPIELNQVEMIKIDGDWYPKIDVRKLADEVVKVLATQKERLTGNQVKFIRTYFAMSLRRFSKDVVHESHTAVSKWEKFGDSVTNMDRNIEIMLRLFIIERVEAKTVKQKNSFYQKYVDLKSIFSSDKKTSSITVDYSAVFEG
ncbi:MAG: hypothetical protein P1U40_12420 [Coxiellaceae bacterium]|nr:hypothetical protein [Coxiellaceae bacterium]